MSVDYDKAVNDYLNEIEQKIKPADNDVEGTRQKIMINIAANVFRDLMKKVESSPTYQKYP